jgi:acetoin utilization deacetylase AcuC-like enzyme
MSVGLVYDPLYLRHDTGQHLENAARLVETMRLLEASGLKDQLIQIRPEAASRQELLIHSTDHVANVESMAQSGGGWLDGDTVTSPQSYNVALSAVGGTLAAARSVIEGQVQTAFALVRPPGHHATRTRAMGFCLFNNIAITARHLVEKHGIERVLIVDFDVHHGNGTQEAFYGDPTVLYFSTHQYPFYPGTGTIEEIGVGAGKGATINVPLPAWCGDDEYLRVFEHLLVPAARRFQPQIILVSAGYDAHWADRISMMQVSITGLAAMVGTLKWLADDLCRQRLVFALEGGYHTQALPHSIQATLEVLLGVVDVDDPLGGPAHGRTPSGAEEIIQAVRRIHNL